MMQARHSQIPIKEQKALEMRMREVMENLEDSCTYTAYQSTPDSLEILSIESPKADPYGPTVNNPPCKAININSRKNPFVSAIKRDAYLERL